MQPVDLDRLFAHVVCPTWGLIEPRTQEFYSVTCCIYKLLSKSLVRLVLGLFVALNTSLLTLSCSLLSQNHYHNFAKYMLARKYPHAPLQNRSSTNYDFRAFNYS